MSFSTLSLEFWKREFVDISQHYINTVLKQTVCGHVSAFHQYSSETESFWTSLSISLVQFWKRQFVDISYPSRYSSEGNSAFANCASYKIHPQTHTPLTVSKHCLLQPANSEAHINHLETKRKAMWSVFCATGCWSNSWMESSIAVLDSLWSWTWIDTTQQKEKYLFKFFLILVLLTLMLRKMLF
jgi:hypothetical protein